jgi:hypothetical protein
MGEDVMPALTYNSNNVAELILIMDYIEHSSKTTFERTIVVSGKYFRS